MINRSHFCVKILGEKRNNKQKQPRKLVVGTKQAALSVKRVVFLALCFSEEN